MSLWASIRDQGFESLGLTKEIRDELQPLVDQAAVLGGNVFPLDGYVPPNTQGLSDKTVLPTSLAFVNQKILGIPAWAYIAIILVMGIFLIRGKK